MVLNPQDKIFITGATGFLGSHLTRLLVERGLDVTILARPASDHPLLSGLKLSRVEGDITDYASVLRGMKGSSTFYGPGDVKLHSGEVFRNIASGLLKIAPPGGNGVISIRDCAEGLVAAMEKGRMGERYILNSENLTILEIFIECGTIAMSCGSCRGSPPVPLAISRVDS